MQEDCGSGRMWLRRAGWPVAISLTVALPAAAVVSVVNHRQCAALLGSAAAASLFDAAVADRAATERLESNPSVLVWLQADPPSRIWLADSQRCAGRSQLRVLFREEAHRKDIQERLDGSSLRDLGPAWLDRD